MKVIRIVGVLFLASVVGYFIPDFLKLDKKMEFVNETEELYRVIECETIDDKCTVDSYQLQFLTGRFGILERTSFRLLYDDHSVATEILITSDDGQFGTIRSQREIRGSDIRQALIPYCGNPLMNIVVIDEARQTGILIK
ncbi:hypothetical protein R3X26_15560 [Vibrio sp. TH_r3]|uniref:hypothetical protein n=1 Tax=Vibrio sp. TH_r3 TaxID=3082084 RepID=UPI002952ED10|nr:hypothetical protein [Vibrio sp. TH_r3]MDV7105822.1 hypothetical protein [Vibrio sp. TH_r3]